VPVIEQLQALAKVAGHGVTPKKVAVPGN
jgi:hypothetical protein